MTLPIEKFHGRTRRDFLKAAGVTGGLLIAGDVLAACGSSSSSTTAASEAKRRGGTLRAGILGGSQADTLDANAGLSYPDTARSLALYSTLARYTPDLDIELLLAESIEPNKDASQWTIRLKDGIKFHNGKPLTADDVMFTFRRIIEGNLIGVAVLGAVDVKSMKKLDSRTLRLNMLFPFVTLLPAVTQISNQIVPVGYDPKKPIGTGPFKYESFTPGRQSRFVRFDDYFEKGLPYADALVITDFADDSARLNALLGGEVDMIDQVSPSQIASIEGGGQKITETPTAQWTPFTMRVDAAPFDDVRVRQAMRLAVDRPQMIEQATSNRASLGNDVFGKDFPGYDTSIPQREQDIEQVSSLLKQAGQENLKVDLVSSPTAVGLTQAAQVFAKQASDAGISVNVRQLSPTEFFSNYTQWPFAQDFIFGLDYLLAASYTTIKGAALSTTHFLDPKYDKLYKQANALTDENARNQVIAEMQRIDYDQGGYIIPYFPNTIDASTPNVTGILKAKTGIPLGNYRFDVIAFTKG